MANPQTRAEAKKMMLDALQKGAQINGVKVAVIDRYYEPQDSTGCIIGVLLTDAQREDIIRNGLNGTRIGGVCRWLGEKNVQAVFGSLTEDELREIQESFDDIPLSKNTDYSDTVEVIKSLK